MYIYTAFWNDDVVSWWIMTLVSVWESLTRLPRVLPTVVKQTTNMSRTGDVGSSDATMFEWRAGASKVIETLPEDHALLPSNP